MSASFCRRRPVPRFHAVANDPLRPAVAQAAADAEAAARGSESWFSRASSCIDAEARATASATRVSSLTVGDDRPRYVPVRAGREAYADLVVLMDAAQLRARAACRSIEQPR